MKVGVLALQGAVAEQLEMLADCGAEAVRVRKREDFLSLDGLIIPGGESTTIGRLIDSQGLREGIIGMKEAGKPILGTCAGLVLLGREIKDRPAQKLLNLMDTVVVRNGFGRQRESFEADLKIPVLGEEPFRGVFIRAPYIASAGAGVEVLLELEGKIVAARQDNVIALSFHPEVTGDNRLHRYFLSTISLMRSSLRKPPRYLSVHDCV